MGGIHEDRDWRRGRRGFLHRGKEERGSGSVSERPGGHRSFGEAAVPQIVLCDRSRRRRWQCRVLAGGKHGFRFRRDTVRAGGEFRKRKRPGRIRQCGLRKQRIRFIRKWQFRKQQFRKRQLRKQRPGKLCGEYAGKNFSVSYCGSFRNSSDGRKDAEYPCHCLWCRECIGDLFLHG